MKLILPVLLAAALVAVPASAEAKRPKPACVKVTEATGGLDYVEYVAYVKCSPRTVVKVGRLRPRA